MNSITTVGSQSSLPPNSSSTELRVERQQIVKSLVLELLELTHDREVTELSTPDGCLDELLCTFELEDHELLLIRRRFPLNEARVDLPSLSPRELAIARLVAKGLPNKSIGHVLEISPWTVATHLRRIFTKLQVASRAAMVARLTGLKLL